MYLPTDAAYYRWTDDDGKTHYSYSVPAEKSQLGHVELSKQGIKTKEVISAKRKKQLKELADLRKMHKEQAAKDSKIKAFQDEEDNLLLSVFSSERELIKAYNTKLQLAQVTIDLLKGRHKKQSEKLEVLEHKYERVVDIKYKQALEKQIDVVLDNLKIYQQAITENLIEKDKVKGEYEATLTRFKKLMVKADTKN
jgi:small-conductance mechanosensitive channel